MAFILKFMMALITGTGINHWHRQKKVEGSGGRAPNRRATFAILSLVSSRVKISCTEHFFFVSLMYAENFLYYAENILRTKIWLKKQKYARRTKFFTLLLNKPLKSKVLNFSVNFMQVINQ